MLTLYSYPPLFGVADNNGYGLKVFAFLKLAGVPETGRAEDVDIAGFCAIARALEDGGGEKAVR